jgi:hypothetical protein
MAGDDTIDQSPPFSKNMETKRTRPVCFATFVSGAATDGGVRMDNLDSEKLSEWCRRKIGADFEAESSQENVICQYCLLVVNLSTHT